MPVSPYGRLSRSRQAEVAETGALEAEWRCSPRNMRFVVLHILRFHELGQHLADSYEILVLGSWTRECLSLGGKGPSFLGTAARGHSTSCCCTSRQTELLCGFEGS